MLNHPHPKRSSKYLYLKQMTKMLKQELVQYDARKKVLSQNSSVAITLCKMINNILSHLYSAILRFQILADNGHIMYSNSGIYPIFQANMKSRATLHSHEAGNPICAVATKRGCDNEIYY